MSFNAFNPDDANTSTAEPTIVQFRLYTFEEIILEPPKQWHIKGLIGKRDIVLVYGHGKIGKTLVTFDMIGALVCGDCEFADVFPIVSAPNVVYATGEGHSGLSQRFNALDLKWGFTDEQRARLHVLKELPQLFDPNTAHGIQQFAEWVKGTHGDILKDGILVLDTLARASLGAEENSAKDTAVILEALHAAAQYLECTIIVIHHASKAGAASHGSDIRGSSNLLAGFDNAIHVRQGPDGSRVMGSDVAKDSGQIDDLEFKISVHEWQDLDGETHKGGYIEWTGARIKKASSNATIHSEIVDIIRTQAIGEANALFASEIRGRMEIKATERAVTEHLKNLRELPTSLVQGVQAQTIDRNGQPNKMAWKYFWSGDDE